MCDAAGIPFTGWIWSWFLCPRAKCCHTCEPLSSAAAPCSPGQLGMRGAQEGRAQLVCCSCSPSAHPSLEKLWLGQWEGDTCVVTSMSLLFLDVSPGVWQQGWSGSSSWAHSQGQPCPCSSCTTFWGLSQLLSPGFPVSTDTSLWEGEGRSSLFQQSPWLEPSPAAPTTAKHRSKNVVG